MRPNQRVYHEYTDLGNMGRLDAKPDEGYRSSIDCGRCCISSFTQHGAIAGRRNVFAQWIDLPCHGAGLLFNFSTGIIAREREQGLLATIFARPIKRSTYVLSKWLALGLGVWLVNLGVGLLTLLVYLVNRPDLIVWSDFLSTILTSLLLTLGTSSLLILCSTIGAATSELTLFSMAFSTALISLAVSTMAPMKTGGEHGWILLAAQGQHLLKEVCTVISGPLWFLLFPYIRFPLDATLAPHTLFSYASNVGLALLLAVWTINRREVGYGNA